MLSIVVLSSLLSLASLSSEPSPEARSPVDANANANANAIQARFDAAFEQSSAPAMAVGVVDADGNRFIAVNGERAAGTGVPVEPNDLWHIGSISKSFTAILAARLVDAGLIRWDTTIIEAIPSLEPKISRLYHGVTLEQLLSSRGGVPPFDRGVHVWMSEQVTPPHEHRLEAAERILNLRPVAPPGAWHVYSNFGFIVAGAMLEAAADDSWESLIREHIAEPLDMPTLGFGPPGDPMIDAPDQPWGHVIGPERSLAIQPGPRADNPAAYGPAGTIHASIADLTNYAEAHLGTLRALRDPSTKPDTLTPLGITAASARHVFRVPPSTRESNPPYALGLVVRNDTNGMPVTVWHNGSNTMWYAEMFVRIGIDGTARASFVCANAAGESVERAVSQLARALVEQPFLAAPAQPER